MRRNNSASEFIGYGVLLFVFIIVLAVGRGYRLATFDEVVITPTNYELIRGDGDTDREVFADEGEYRMSDSWFIPYNRETGRWANAVSKAVDANKREPGSMECDVKTWGKRIPVLSLYPVIYEARCYKVGE
ncbi:hypothetical protein VPHD479_0212 [Vibrio phage D479]